MHLNPPMMKKTPEEIENRKTKAPKNIRKENDRFIFLLMRKRLPLGSTLMDHAPSLKKITLYQVQQIRVGTLTRLPPMDLCLVSGGVACLPPSSRSLGSHGNKEKTIPSRFTLGG